MLPIVSLIETLKLSQASKSLAVKGVRIGFAETFGIVEQGDSKGTASFNSVYVAARSMERR